jgi:8-oxo-dGTP diphosphatase
MKIIKCRDVRGKESEVSIDKFKFRPSVYGVLIEDEKILLSRQWDGYDFPGGGIELDETIEEALRREFIEETGIEVVPIIPIHCETDFFNPDYTDKYKGQYWNAVMMYYLVEKLGGKLTKDNLCDTEQEYADMPEWIRLDDIYEKKFFNSVDSIWLIKKAVELKKALNL